MKDIYYFTNIAPHYRQNLWGKLITGHFFNLNIFFGNNKNLKINEIDFSNELFKNHKNQIHRIENSWLRRHILFWQPGRYIQVYSR